MNAVVRTMGSLRLFKQLTGPLVDKDVDYANRIGITGVVVKVLESRVLCPR